MSMILIDRIGAVVFQNNIVRVDCSAAGPNGEERLSGTLLIPASQAATVLQTLVGAAQELDRRLREQAQQTPAANAAAAPAAAASEARPAAAVKSAVEGAAGGKKKRAPPRGTKRAARELN